MTTTTNNASVEAANELDRISNVLTSYDVAPKIDGDGWMPGDPLWKRPIWWQGEQYVRPLFQVFEEEDAHDFLRVPAESHDGSTLERWYPTCETCEVSWEGDEPCWVCGVQPPRAKTVSELLAEIRERQGRVIFVPNVADVNAPTVAELQSAEPVPGLVPHLTTHTEPWTFYYNTTAHSPRFTRRTEPTPLDRMMSDAMLPPLDDYQRAFLDRWVTDRDDRWDTVAGGVTYDDSHPGVPKVTIEIRHRGRTIKSSFYLDHPDDFAMAMRRAVKAIDLQLGYSGPSAGTHRGVEPDWVEYDETEDAGW